MLLPIRVLLPLFAGCVSISASLVALASPPERGNAKCVVEDIDTPTMPACVIESRKGVLYIPKKYWMHPAFNRYGLSAFTVESFGRVYINRAGRIVIRDVAFMDNAPDEFHHGLVRINRDGMWGYADPTGRIIVPVKYSCAINEVDTSRNAGDMPPNSHPFITGDSRLKFGFEIVSSPPRLCGCGKREAVSTSA